MLIKSAQSMTAQLAGTKGFPCTIYNSKEPKLNDKGLQQYSISIQVPGTYRMEQYSIKVYSKPGVDPIEGAEIGDSVEFTGVTAQLGYLSGEGGKRQQFWSLTAESVLVKKQKA